MQLPTKKRMITGITPSGQMTLGNYLGVAKRLVRYQNDYDLLVFIANLHAITTPHDSQLLRERTKQIAALYLAIGLDPKKVTIFRQSDVPAHTQLGWLMTTQTGMGELGRMTQFKDKSQYREHISSGLFTYPALMAADILLYNVDHVPVGIDQKQHVELARDLAIRLNKKYKTNLFKIPEVLLTPNSFKVMDLQIPTKKMSKSNSNTKGVIYLLDSPSVIRKKVNQALTDSEDLITYNQEKKPGVSNLMLIYSLLTNKPLPQLESHWHGKNYHDLKVDVADAIIKELTPIQQRYAQLINSKELESILKHGAMRANSLANTKLAEAYEALGLN